MSAEREELLNDAEVESVVDELSEPEVASEGEAAGYEEDCADLPPLRDLEAELTRVRDRDRSRRFLFFALGLLAVIAAAVIIVTTRFLPVFQIYGDSMIPTLSEGDIVVAFDQGELDRGDLVAFYYDNKVLVKRVIAVSGDWVDIKDDGSVYVNNSLLEEPYVDEAAFGSCNIALPYQVPEFHVFVMGDNRVSSVDSRSTALGCVSEGQVIGELVACVWPLSEAELL